ncbi:hypothetical protein AVEN_64363-2-1, partial [Araneus ventricosus]
RFDLLVCTSERPTTEGKNPNGLEPPGSVR